MPVVSDPDRGDALVVFRTELVVLNEGEISNFGFQISDFGLEN